MLTYYPRTLLGDKVAQKVVLITMSEAEKNESWNEQLYYTYNNVGKRSGEEVFLLLWNLVGRALTFVDRALSMDPRKVHSHKLTTKPHK